MTFESAPPAQKERLPHSKWGIASFVLHIVFIVGLFVYVVICVAVLYESCECVHCGSDCPAEIAMFRLLNAIFWGVIGYLFASLVPVILAIVGLCKSGERKLFVILGFCFSIPHILIWVYFILGSVYLFVMWMLGLEA